jgi:hypothetical protein
LERSRGASDHQRRATRGGAASFLDIAMVHAAVYDAVEAIDGRFKPYHVNIPGASGSPAAATAKAAHDVLINRFPAQTASLDTTYHAYLSNNGLAENDPGVIVGQQAAAGIITLRANDGSYPNPDPPFTGGTNVGEWRPTLSYLPGPPPSLSPMATPWKGLIRHDESGTRRVTPEEYATEIAARTIAGTLCPSC